MSQKHIHFIGICGVAMSALAIALYKKGHKVSGSDVGFYPPISTMLATRGVEFYAGWHPEKMLGPAGAKPDLVIVGNVAGSNNPEWKTVQNLNLTYKSYPEAIAEFWLKEESIVCAGTYGKTTSSALLAWIFSELDQDPNYMFGGLMQSDFPSAKLTDSNWSILEGDEYKSARWDNRPKFAHYDPKYLLLTAVSWDHVDIYPTEKSYLATFKTLVDNVSADGLIVVSADNSAALNLAASAEGPLVITYGTNPDAIYRYDNVEQTPSGLKFDILYQGQKFSASCPLLGSYQAENITGAFALAHELLFEPHKIIAAIASFPGLKRRLERRHAGLVTVFDDIAHSPAKAKVVLETLQSIYSGKIIAVFEPNTGNRKPESKPLYDQAFAAASEVVIPRLTKIKIDPADESPPFEGAELAQTISETHDNVVFIDEDQELVDYLVDNVATGDVIVFLGSHGFRGMIENLISKL